MHSNDISRSGWLRCPIVRGHRDTLGSLGYNGRLLWQFIDPEPSKEYYGWLLGLPLAERHAKMQQAILTWPKDIQAITLHPQQ